MLQKDKVFDELYQDVFGVNRNFVMKISLD